MIFKKTLEKWKSEWLDKNEKALCREFDVELQQLKDSFSETIAAWHKKRNELQNQIETESQQFSLQQNEYTVLTKKLEVSRKNVEDQIRILEAKSSPMNVWTEAFSTGFSKAWDIMIPIMMDGVLKSKKFIEDQAIEETIRRNNGNYKKTH